MEIEIITAPIADETDLLEGGLVALTEAISQIDEDKVAHGCLGGEFGYGAHFENSVFVMRPQYWGDCDCGADERSDEWYSANPHAPDCWQTKRDILWNEYDERVGWKAIEEVAFGSDADDFLSGFDHETSAGPLPGMTVMVSTPRDDDDMNAWRALLQFEN